MTGTKTLYATAVVSVLMGEQNRIDGLRLDFESLQAPVELFQRETIVYQQCGAVVLYHGRIPPATTTQRRNPHNWLFDLLK